MKFTQTGTFRKDFLEEPTTLNLMEKLPNLLLDKLDYFVGYVLDEMSDNVDTFFENLIHKFQVLADKTYSEHSLKKFYELFDEYDNLKQKDDLNKASLSYLFVLLGLDDSDLIQTEVEISMRALLESWTFPPYYLLQTLTETVNREEALNLYKRFISDYFKENPSPNREENFSLEQMLNKRLSGDTSASEWVLVHTMLEEGKYAFKNKNCPTCVDSMTELPDTEIKYLVCCYGDYEMFRATYSDHIRLTMEHTLMQGDSYCSRVLHDTRIVDDFKHPPKDFWDNFEPGKEEEAVKYYKI